MSFMFLPSIKNDFYLLPPNEQRIKSFEDIEKHELYKYIENDEVRKNKLRDQLNDIYW